VILALTYNLSSIIPFGVWDCWATKGTLTDWFRSSWPLFAWGFSLATLTALLKPRKIPEFKLNPGFLVAVSFLLSAFAGVVEELTYRWLFYLSAFAGLWILNWASPWVFGFLIVLAVFALGKVFLDTFEALLTGLVGLVFAIILGWSGYLSGIPEWFHLNAAGPFANWITLGYLEPYIFHPTGWLVGAAMLSVNASFRDNHKYQGWVGVLNSWFIGMFLFWVMFTYGILVAILMHFLYDLMIFLYGSFRLVYWDRL